MHNEAASRNYLNESLTAPQAETFRMETDLDGLLVLLGESLYASPDVFIRELLQNCHDAIVVRRRLEPSLVGQIGIKVDHAERSITFRENGIGMDHADLRQVFSVIGSSGKRGKEGVEALRDMPGLELIGQFGIGFLSAFTVAGRVEVRTRKAGCDGGWLWTNMGSLECRLEPTRLPEAGTEVKLFIRSEYDFVLETVYLREAIVHYGNFLPFCISLNGHGPVNAVHAPWHAPGGTAGEAAYRELIERSYHDVPLEVIPVSIDGSCRARGVLYITSERLPDFGSKGTLELYVRRMFVAAGNAKLLPPWAKFVRGVIDSPDLKPTASRDGIREDDPATLELRHRLGEVIVEHLIKLAEGEPERFARLAEWHHYHLKGMACLHPDFFRRIGRSLPLDTNRGKLNLEQCLSLARQEAGRSGLPKLRYQQGEGSFSQFRRLAEAKGWLVVDASSPIDVELLRTFGRQHRSEVELVRLDAGDPPGLFGRLQPAAEERFRLLEGEIAGCLRQAGVERLIVRTRSFAPEDIPALILRDRGEEELDDLRQNLQHPGLLDAAREIAGGLLEAGPRRTSTLTLNASNPVIARLADMPKWRDLEESSLGWHAGILDAMLCSLFTTSLLASGGQTGRQEADLLRSQLSRIFAGMLHLLETHGESREAIAGLERNLGGEGLSPGHFNC